MLLAVDSSNVRPVPAALRASSLALVHVPSIRRAQALQALAVQVRQVDVQDLGRAQDLALRVQAASAHVPAPAVLRRPVKHRVRNAHRRIAHAAVASSIRRPKKAQ